MDKLPNMQSIESYGATLQEWVITHILATESLQQIIAISIAIMLSMIVARRISGGLDTKTRLWRERNLYLIASRIHISIHEMVQLVLMPLLLWAAVAAAEAVGWPSLIMSGAASLISAWVGIRLGSSVIRSPFWAKTLAIVLWTVAALNILGWLDPAITTLDKTTLPFGAHSLSLLLLLKGGIILAFLLWLAGVASEGLERALWRSHLSPSQKVLFHKLTKILFITLAIAFGLNVVGIDLTALAVFSGALGIGIGFGLQKVFANLMSGFILLMDKSIKPGDVIAVEDTYGWVNRLGARYVSILTRDGKEHLIPNETLITERVENWTYTDGKIRIHIPVGVSYTADVPTVKKLLLEVASQHPRVLKTPAPACLIKGFGDSSVDFEIRAWIEDPINGISNVRSGIYEEIWKTFKEHSIEIPFPQRDLNFNMQQLQQLIDLMRSSSTK